MKQTIQLTLIALCSSIAMLSAQERQTNTSDSSDFNGAEVDERLAVAINWVKERPFPASILATALIDLLRSENVDEANGLVLEHIASRTNEDGVIATEGRPELLFRIALLQESRSLLSPQALAGIEKYAWTVLEIFPWIDEVDKSFRNIGGSENHAVNDMRK